MGRSGFTQACSIQRSLPASHVAVAVVGVEDVLAAQHAVDEAHAVVRVPLVGVAGEALGRGAFGADPVAEAGQPVRPDLGLVEEQHRRTGGVEGLVDEVPADEVGPDAGRLGRRPLVAGRFGGLGGGDEGGGLDGRGPGGVERGGLGRVEGGLGDRPPDVVAGDVVVGVLEPVGSGGARAVRAAWFAADSRVLGGRRAPWSSAGWAASDPPQAASSSTTSTRPAHGFEGSPAGRCHYARRGNSLARVWPPPTSVSTSPATSSAGRTRRTTSSSPRRA